MTASDHRLKVDLHTHILPENIPNFHEKFGYGDWITLDHISPTQANMILDGKNFRTIDCNCWSTSQRLSDCDATGVDVQVLSTVPVMFNYAAKPEHCLEMAQFLNDHISQVVTENPRRFVGLGTVPMQDPAMAVKEMERCMNELGMSGIQIGSHINEWNLDAIELDEFWRAAERLQASIFVHPWDMDNGPRNSKYWFPWLVGMPCETTMAICSMIFGGVLERFPRLKVCFAHGGGSFPGTLGRIEHGFIVRPDLCQTNSKVLPSEYIGRIYVDSLVHDPDTLKFLLTKMTLSRVILGSDYPFPLGEHHPGKMVEQMDDLDEETKRKVLGLNACEFLGVDPKRFSK